jgi:hypothetical protein
MDRTFAATAGHDRIQAGRIIFRNRSAAHFTAMSIIASPLAVLASFASRANCS